MKFSEIWLREWVNPQLDTEQLAEQLTMAGLEVDDIDPVAGDFSGVVVGLVVECAQHPNADKLRVTKVDVGGEGLLDIVCGAANCRQGLKVACATVGAQLPDNFKIKTTKLRGEPSEGMLCSYSELGIAIEQDGIIELPESAPIGMDLRDYLRLNDHSIELSITPNRADCLGILGLAREVGVLNRLPIQKPDMSPVEASVETRIPIQIDAPEACPRYLGRVVQGIDIHAKTPLWMQEKLRRSGIRSIDAVVDITNFVLLELGQPIHAFDLHCIDERIIVRMVRQGERLTLLDGQEITLDAETLVIADKTKALALAGVFGGIHSGINDTTQDILLECAYFNPLSIAGRARQYGLRTDASHRYERGVDPVLQYQAVERATRLLLEICGGQAGPIIDMTTQSALPKRPSLILRRSKLDSLLGHPIADQQVEQILTHLGCQVQEGDESWQVTPPSWRFDISLEEDLIEEVARVYGYNNIPDIPLPAESLIATDPEVVLPLFRLKELLVDSGFQEAMTYSFVDPKMQQQLHPEELALLLLNPISSEMSAMRLSLWSGLLAAVIYNQNRQQSRIRLFESGLCFRLDEKAPLGVQQKLMLAGVITGSRYQEQWDLPEQPVDFFDLKGEVERLVQLTGQSHLLSFKAQTHTALHPGQSAAIYLQDEKIGYIGTIHPDLERRLDLNGHTIVFEVCCEPLLQRIVPQAQPVSRFPANRRDIAIVVKENTPAQDVLAACRKVGVNQLVGVNLFDVYRGKRIAEGYKSLAISLHLQDSTRTLEEEEIAAIVAKCVAVLQERFQASLRD